MYGVVALLDDQHCEMVEALWSEFKREFGTFSAYDTPVPHYSYHVAQAYDMNQLETVLKRVLSKTKPFRVRTNGLGIFTGEHPVLYIPVIRNRTMALLHQRLWQPLTAISTNPFYYYHPDNWRPHITLTHRNVGHELLPEVVRLLSAREFFWEIRIDTIAVISDKGGSDDTIVLRLPLGQPSRSIS